MQKMKRTVVLLFAMALLVGARQSIALAYGNCFDQFDTSWQADVARADVIAVVTILPPPSSEDSIRVKKGFVPRTPIDYIARVDRLIKFHHLGYNSPLREGSPLRVKDNFSSYFPFRMSLPILISTALQPGPALVFLKRTVGSWQVLQQSPVRDSLVDLDGSMENTMSLERQVRFIEGRLDWKDTAKFESPPLLSPHMRNN